MLLIKGTEETMNTFSINDFVSISSVILLSLH